MFLRQSQVAAQCFTLRNCAAFLLILFFVFDATETVFAQEVSFAERINYEASVNSRLIDRHAVQRAIYIDLKKAVVDGDFAAVKKSRAKLNGYPLEYYFDYLLLRHRIGATEQPVKLLKSVAAHRFQYKDSNLYRRLLGVMKNRLVKLEQWQDYATVAKLDNAPVHPCDDLLARVENSRLKHADNTARALWAQPDRHTGNCDKAFATLVRNPSDVSTRALWQRTVALLLQGNTTEINKLLPFFGARDRETVLTWIGGLEQPEAALRNPAAEGKTPHHRKVSTFLLRRWAREDLVSASEFWQQRGERFGFSTEEILSVGSKYAVLAAKRRMPESGRLLAAAFADRQVRYWRVRVALLEQNWSLALQNLDALKTAEQKTSRWKYWRARVLAELGRKGEADSIFRSLAENFDYFGFLAADQLSMPYNITAKVPQTSAQALQDLEELPQIVRAVEFFLTGTGWEGRRLWNASLKAKDKGKEYYIAAARLAMSVGWVDRALASMELSQEKRALDVLFPTPYQNSVAHLADYHSVSRELIYGVMKQESAFIPDIKSSAGAVGLMQLMLPTARDMGKKLGVKVPGWKLTDSELNIQLGVTYLGHVLDRFGENTVLATAAYNAGPHRVSQWITDQAVPADIWVETIPFDETRRYVRAVLFNTTVSEWRLQKGKLTRLRQRMPDVLPLG